MSSPIKKYRYGNIELSVWANETKDGKPYFAFTIQKNYKNNTGEWKQSNSFNSADLGAIAILATRVACEGIEPRAVNKTSAALQSTANSDDEVPF